MLVILACWRAALELPAKPPEAIAAMQVGLGHRGAGLLPPMAYAAIGQPFKVLSMSFRH